MNLNYHTVGVDSNFVAVFASKARNTNEIRARSSIVQLIASLSRLLVTPVGPIFMRAFIG